MHISSKMYNIRYFFCIVRYSWETPQQFHGQKLVTLVFGRSQNPEILKYLIFNDNENHPMI